LPSHHWLLVPVSFTLESLSAKTKLSVYLFILNLCHFLYFIHIGSDIIGYYAYAIQQGSDCKIVWNFLVCCLLKQYYWLLSVLYRHSGDVSCSALNFFSMAN